jgi:hypothetical protein
VQAIFNRRVIRTETTINHTYDSQIGRSLSNLPALRELGFTANQRLLRVENLSHDCLIGDDRFQGVIGPVVVDSQRAAGLRFWDRRALTDHLRRLRLHQLIERIPKTHRYRVTDTGLRTALFCFRLYARALRPALARDSTPPPSRAGAAACQRLEAAMDTHPKAVHLAASKT